MVLKGLILTLSTLGRYGSLGKNWNLTVSTLRASGGAESH